MTYIWQQQSAEADIALIDPHGVYVGGTARDAAICPDRASEKLDPQSVRGRVVGAYVEEEMPVTPTSPNAQC